MRRIGASKSERNVGCAGQAEQFIHRMAGRNERTNMGEVGETLPCRPSFSAPFISLLLLSPIRLLHGFQSASRLTTIHGALGRWIKVEAGTVRWVEIGGVDRNGGGD